MGPFITLLSDTYGLHEPSVAAVARVMREAGWLTTGARGVNAPEMTHVDAARLTLALLSGEPPGKVVEEFEFLRRLEAKTPPSATGFTAGSGLDQAHCLEDGLVWLFSLTNESTTIREHGSFAFRHWFWPNVTVSVDSSERAAQVHYAGQSCSYEDLARERELEKIMAQPDSRENWLLGESIQSRSADWGSGVALQRRMRVVRTIENSEIAKIANAVAATAPLNPEQN
jgi:hypothetical protein